MLKKKSVSKRGEMVIMCVGNLVYKTKVHKKLWTNNMKLAIMKGILLKEEKQSSLYNKHKMMKHIRWKFTDTGDIKECDTATIIAWIHYFTF